MSDSVDSLVCGGGVLSYLVVSCLLACSCCSGWW